MQTAGDRLTQAAHRLERAGIERPRMEAELLLALALGVTRLDVLRGPDPEPDASAWHRFDSLVAARETRVPLAYLRGTQEFYGLEFLVSPAVLVPRPETEILVDLAREKLAELPRPALADVGTGSGCIAVSAAVHLVDALVVALDCSRDALEVARLNAGRLAVSDRVRLLRADLLTVLRPATLDMVLANPPYIPSAEVPGLQVEVRDHEPRVALDGGPDGLAAHRAIVRHAMQALRPGGWLGVEVAQGQASSIVTLYSGAGLAGIEVRRDLAGTERVVVGKRP